MDRRTFLGTLAGTLLAAPLAAETEQAGEVHRIGFLGTTTLANTPYLIRAFTDGLSELGYVEGTNLIVEYRWAGGVSDRLPKLAADLVNARVEVIVAPGNLAVVAAKTATNTIPIVAPWFVNPVSGGLVASLARPGGNVTGLQLDVGTELAGKRLELFKQVLPPAPRVANLWPPNYPGYRDYWPEMRRAAAALDIVLYGVEAPDGEKLESALATIAKTSPNGLFIWVDPWLSGRRHDICGFALQKRIPTLSASASFTAAGCLMSYAANEPDLFKRAASYVDKILKGAKAADLPVEQPIKYELVINLKTAKALSLTIPPSLLQRADQVIE